MADIGRRALFLSIGAIAVPLAGANAQMNWYEDRHRRGEYESWRQAEWRRREQEARREHRVWRRNEWNDEREREAWARQQRWYR